MEAEHVLFEWTKKKTEDFGVGAKPTVLCMTSSHPITRTGTLNSNAFEKTDGSHHHLVPVLDYGRPPVCLD